MRRAICFLTLIVLISPPAIQLDSVAQEVAIPTDSDADSFATQQLQDNLEGTFRAEDVIATTSWVQTTGIVDWLGPLAPVALSPFFGVTCLSGLAIWGPEWGADNALLGASGPLQNQTLFFVFLALTVVTSLPRLTKVSKPIAQAVDRLETYAVIIILLAIKLLSSEGPTGDESVAMVQLGIVSFTLETLLAIAMVVNILVINSVKFFFEFMVWLTPVPFLDAVFEVCNKSLCASLMMIYAFSPTLATVINLLILLFAAVVLRWISRRVRFYRTMVLDPILSQFWTSFGNPRRPELVVFPKGDLGPFKAKSRLKLRRSDDGNEGWVLDEANWWMPAKSHTLSLGHDPRVRLGWVMHAIEINDDGEPTLLSFSRRYDRETLQKLVDQLGMPLLSDPTEEVDDPRAHEFA